MNISVVIAASGKSTRMAGGNKLLMKLQGEPVIVRTIRAFFDIKEITQIVVVCHHTMQNEYQQLVDEYFSSAVKLVTGGKSRRESVYNGIKALAKDTDMVLIHDGARPLIKKQEIKSCIEHTKIYKACALGVKCIDTIKEVNDQKIIVGTVERSKLYNVQTPQCFMYDIACDIHKKGEHKKIEVTDDCTLAEIAGYQIYMVEGSYDNLKITTIEDLNYAAYVLGNS